MAWMIEARDAAPLCGAMSLGALAAAGFVLAWEPTAVTMLWGAACLALASGVFVRLAQAA